MMAEKHLQVKVSEQLLERLNKLVKDKDMNRNNFVASAINKQLKKYERKS